MREGMEARRDEEGMRKGWDGLLLVDFIDLKEECSDEGRCRQESNKQNIQPRGEKEKSERSGSAD